MLTINALSTEYVRIPVAATLSGVEVNPVSDPLAIAIMPEGVAPDTLDWLTGSWEIDSDTYYARVLVGPDGGETTLSYGLYEVYVKIDDNPEQVVRRVGAIGVV